MRSTPFGCGDLGRSSGWTHLAALTVGAAATALAFWALGTEGAPTRERAAPTAMAYLSLKEVYNPEAPIPPQCYTRTEGRHNPCYVCHQVEPADPQIPNEMSDGGLQGSYAFSDVGTTNHWTNLFRDRSQALHEISDRFIDRYVGMDNYRAWLLRVGKAARARFRIDFLPEPERAFDDQGFALDGSHWVAYNYKPFPSTFWPTNGSFGDAMVRLPAAFREMGKRFQRDIYRVNLGLLEMTIKGLERISTEPLDELKMRLDVNGDGVLSDRVTQLRRRQAYVGDASDVQVQAFLYPEGTEFLHTVRYLSVEAGQVAPSRRLKELRYMVKKAMLSPAAISNTYHREHQDKEYERLPKIHMSRRGAVLNGFGWELSGYIENALGRLRPQEREELAYCLGCHKSIGGTIDQTFSFARKVEGRAGWGYIDLRAQTDVPSATRTDGRGEYLIYLERVGGGDEFRQNEEMLRRWFNLRGTVNTAAVTAVDSLHSLITPSVDRARKLNKAYLSIVREQSFIFGRDATINSARNVLRQVGNRAAPLYAEHRYDYDLRLNWTGAAAEQSR